MLEQRKERREEQEPRAARNKRREEQSNCGPENSEMNGYEAERNSIPGSIKNLRIDKFLKYLRPKQKKKTQTNKLISVLCSSLHAFHSHYFLLVSFYKLNWFKNFTR